jgi:hypothetical protein
MILPALRLAVTWIEIPLTACAHAQPLSAGAPADNYSLVFASRSRCAGPVTLSEECRLQAGLRTSAPRRNGSRGRWPPALDPWTSTPYRPRGGTCGFGSRSAPQCHARRCAGRARVAVGLTEGVVYRREHPRVKTLVAPGDCTSPLIDGAAQASQVIWPEYPVELDSAAASSARELDEGGEVVVFGNDPLIAPTCRAR